MFIEVGSHIINTDQIQHVTRHAGSITINFAGQGRQIDLQEAEAKLFIQKLVSDDKPGRFYSA